MNYMKHNIIVKFSKDAPSVENMLPRINEIFSGVLEVDGVESFCVFRNCINRDNRYDIMIQIDMSRESLENYDHCQAHIIWKEEFSAYIEKKAIFDFE